MDGSVRHETPGTGAGDDAPTRARLYRMAMPGHLCPYGLKSRWLLDRAGYAVEDHLLITRGEIDAFLTAHGVETTPQTWIGETRVGGYTELSAHLGRPLPGADETSYRPVAAIFAVAALTALAVAGLTGAHLMSARPAELFVATAMILLGLQKLQDVEGFSTMFLNYDLLARHFVPYAYLYPYLETAAGLLMLAGVLVWLSAPVAIVIGAIGAASVVKAVCVEGRELKCACVGGGSRVPLGFVSLTENVMMLAMGLWMLPAA